MVNKIQLDNCSNCNDLFIRGSSSLCKNCLNKTNQEVELLCNVFQEYPTIGLDSALSITDISNERFERIAQSGKLKYYNNININCKICKVPLGASSNRALCNNCYNNLFTDSGSSIRISKLRRNLKIRDKAHKMNMYSRYTEEKRKPFRFTKALREHFSKYINSHEAEILPDIFEHNKLKLSGSFSFIKPSIKNTVNI